MNIFCMFASLQRAVLCRAPQWRRFTPVLLFISTILQATMATKPLATRQAIRSLKLAGDGARAPLLIKAVALTLCSLADLTRASGCPPASKLLPTYSTSMPPTAWKHYVLIELKFNAWALSL